MVRYIPAGLCIFLCAHQSKVKSVPCVQELNYLHWLVKGIVEAELRMTFSHCSPFLFLRE